MRTLLAVYSGLSAELLMPVLGMHNFPKCASFALVGFNTQRVYSGCRHMVREDLCWLYILVCLRSF